MKYIKKNLTIGTKKVNALLERATLIERARNYKFRIVRSQRKRNKLATEITEFKKIIIKIQREIIRNNYIIKDYKFNGKKN